MKSRVSATALCLLLAACGSARGDSWAASNPGDYPAPAGPPEYGAPPQGGYAQGGYPEPGYSRGSASDQTPGAGYSAPGTTYQAPGDRAPAYPGSGVPSGSRDYGQYPAQGAGQQAGYAPPPPPGYTPPVTNGPHGSSQRQPGEARYDELGFAGIAGPGLGSRVGPNAVAVANRTLPGGTVVEVTSVDTGRVILALVTDQGPPSPDLILDLSASAARMLGIQRAPAPVRVRLVTVPAQDQAALARGEPASPRLDAPASLLAGLRRNLGTVPQPGAAPRGAASSPVRAAVPAKGRYVVQVAALSSSASAERLAGQLGGFVNASGRLYRVQLGPFADRAAAEAGRRRAAQAGFGDATIIDNP